MNNELKNYLSQKLETAGDKVTAIKDHIKNGATKAIATGLALATLTGGMVACDDKTNKPADTTPAIKTEATIDDSTLTTEVPGTEITTNTPDSTEATTTEPDTTTNIDIPVEDGITAEEVLALYDDFATKLLNFEDARPDTKVEGEFISITPIQDDMSNPVKTIIYERPYFAMEDEYQPLHYWVYDKLGLDNVPSFENSIYKVCINTIKSHDGYSYEKSLNNFGVNREIMESLFNAFKIQKFTLTNNHIAGLPNESFCSDHVGKEVYEPITISKDTIKNATPEQLKILKELIDSLISINIYAQYPEIEQEYDINNINY